MSGAHGLSVLVHRDAVFGFPTVRYSCTCGAFSSGTFRTEDEDRAAAELREHLADAHGDALKVGRCEKCGQPTDHFRAATMAGDLYLCEAHSPSMSDLAPS